MNSHDTPFSPLVVVKKRFEYIITDKVNFYKWFSEVSI